VERGIGTREEENRSQKEGGEVVFGRKTKETREKREREKKDERETGVASSSR